MLLDEIVQTHCTLNLDRGAKTNLGQIDRGRHIKDKDANLIIPCSIQLGRDGEIKISRLLSFSNKFAEKEVKAKGWKMDLEEEARNLSNKFVRMWFYHTPRILE